MQGCVVICSAVSAEIARCLWCLESIEYVGTSSMGNDRETTQLVLSGRLEVKVRSAWYNPT